MDIDISFYRETEIKVSIEDINGSVIAEKAIGSDGTIALEVSQPVLWNAENPYLYTLVLWSEKETIVDHIAIRTVEIRKSVIYLNWQKIKFHGVNRHDSDRIYC